MPRATVAAWLLLCAAHLGGALSPVTQLADPALASRTCRVKTDDDGGTPPLTMARHWWPKPPAIHFTPVGMTTREPPHDIAAVLWEPKTRTWWVWIYGCEDPAVAGLQADAVRPLGWQLISSADLVNWQIHDRPTPVGGTGSAMIDPRTNETLLITNNVQLWRGKPGAPAGRQWTSGFAEAVDIARPCNPQWPGGGSHSQDCGDAPSLLFDERVEQYCILTMFGHRLPHNRFNGTRGFGLAYQSCSANITGGFVMGKAPWLELDGLVQLRGLPGPGIVNQTQEFLSVDFFPLPSAAARLSKRGASKQTETDEQYGFLSTTYGQTESNHGRYHDFVSIFLGERPQPLGSFAPDLSKTAALDWSPFTVVDDAVSPNLTLARAHGMSQFSCCPKTGGDLNRRVVFGGLTNGWNQGMSCQGKKEAWKDDPGCEERTLATVTTNNTLALPRDLSTAADGTLRQAFVHELQSCRRRHTHLANLTLDGRTGNRSQPHFIAASGTQLEILARFRLAEPLAVGKFGLVVLSSGAEEYTAIAFDQARRHMLLDRSKSGPPGLLGNNDVRAGPWLGSSVDVLLHAYVDNQIVSFIANNETSISAWVDPTMASSRKVGLFAELSGDDSVELVSLDVWQLERASIEV